MEQIIQHPIFFFFLPKGKKGLNVKKKKLCSVEQNCPSGC